MQIRQTGQPIPVSKVETDRREEVKKIKPIGSQKIPDSFETGKPSATESQSNTSSAEPEKKVGQITGGILIRGLTSARLGDSGIKSKKESTKEATSKKEIKPGLQAAAEELSPEIRTRRDGIGTQIGFSSENIGGSETRTSRDEMGAALQKFLAEQGIDTTGTGNGATTTPGGIDPSGFAPVTGDGINVGGFDPSDQVPGLVNDAVARAKEEFESLRYQALNPNSQGHDVGHGKSMIMDGGDGVTTIEFDRIDGGIPTHVTQRFGEDAAGPFVRNTQTSDFGSFELSVTDLTRQNPTTGTVYTHHWETLSYGEGPKKEESKDTSTDRNGNTTTTTGTWERTETGSKDTETTEYRDNKGNLLRTETTTTESSTSTNQNGDEVQTTTVKTETKDADGKQTSSKTETTTVTRHKNADGSTTVTTKNPDGTSETHDEPAPSAGSTTMDDYQDPEAAALMRMNDKILQNLGLAGIWDIQRGPKPKGNVDPVDGASPEGVSTVGSGSKLGQLGKEFLIGQPGRTDEANGGNSPSLPNSGGIFTPNVDYGPDSDKSGYVGKTRTEDASDVVESDPSLNQTPEEKEEIRKLISNPKDIKKQMPNLKRNL